jgi:signal transduction histidine kinase
VAKQVINLLEQRYQNQLLLAFQDKLKKRNQELENFAHIVSHDLKSPLNNIVSLAELLEKGYREKIDGQGLQYLEYLKTSSHSLREYINGLLKFYKSEDLLKKEPERIEFADLIEELIKITDTEHKIHFHYNKDLHPITVNKAALLQVLINLTTNAIKYNRKPETEINISVREQKDNYLFEVQDNGDGIPKEYLKNVFQLFSVVGTPDRDGNIGTGIGLATVKKIIESLGGEISVTSQVGAGSTFCFTIGKYSAMA